MEKLQLDVLEKKYRLILDVYNDDFLNENITMHEKSINMLANCFFLLLSEARVIDEKMIHVPKTYRKKDLSVEVIVNVFSEILSEKNKLTHSKKNQMAIDRNIEMIKKLYKIAWEEIPYSPYLQETNYYYITAYVNNKKSMLIFKDLLERWYDISDSEKLCSITTLENVFLLNEEISIPIDFRDLSSLDEMIEEYIEGVQSAINLFEYICKSQKELLFGYCLGDKDEKGLLFALSTLNLIVIDELAYIINVAKKLETEKYNVDELHGCIIEVPLNENGVKELDEFFLNRENVKSFHLETGEYYVLRKQGGVFDEFDNELKTHIGISIHEEHLFYKKDIVKAIGSLKKYKSKVEDDAEKHLIDKLEEMLILAKESETFMKISIV